jgi:hypothetical protein
MVFIINGYLGSGKDTFVEMVRKNWDEFKLNKPDFKNTEVINISSIDYLKDIFKEEFRWDGSKTPELRKALVQIHMALSEWNDLPYVLTCERIKEEHLKGNIVFVHCREPINIFKYSAAFQAPAIFIDNEQAKNVVLLNKEKLTLTDLDVENYQYNIRINNNSTFEKLDQQAKNFIYDYVLTD